MPQALLRVRPIRFHDQRHTSASLMRYAGVLLPVVRWVLRHRETPN
jgi:hypothetical protein